VGASAGILRPVPIDADDRRDSVVDNQRWRFAARYLLAAINTPIDRQTDPVDDRDHTIGTRPPGARDRHYSKARSAISLESGSSPPGKAAKLDWGLCVAVRGGRRFRKGIDRYAVGVAGRTDRRLALFAANFVDIEPALIVR
jgi:hypothetical protein